MKSEKVKLIVILFTICFYVLPIYSSSASDELLRKIIVGKDIEINSGKVVLVRSAFKKCIDPNMIISGKVFIDENSKQRYLNSLRATHKVDYSLKTDKTEYTIERLYFTGEKRRRDFTSIDAEKASNISFSDLDSISFQSFVQEPNKTVLFTQSKNSDGQIRNHCDIITGKIFFPEFYSFQRTVEATQATIDNLVVKHKELFEYGATVTEQEIDGQLHCIFEVPTEGASLKIIRIMDPNYDMATTYYAYYMRGQLNRELIMQDYQKTPNGFWYPGTYTENNYLLIDNENILVSSEKYEALPGTVDFNINIEDEIFTDFMPDGTQVRDERYNPPLKYVVGEPIPEPPIN